MILPSESTEKLEAQYHLNDPGDSSRYLSLQADKLKCLLS